MLLRQAPETSTYHLRARVGHLVRSSGLVEGERMYVVLVELVELAVCFLEQRARSLLLCWA